MDIEYRGGSGMLKFLIILIYTFSLATGLTFLLMLYEGQYITSIFYLVLAVSSFVTYLNIKYEGGIYV